jgi:glucose uptake protein GlcU
MAVPGGISGLLWSIGNMCSILSVTYLGQGVGYSVTQSAMLISGMWGIFYFHEITNINAIRGWMASACLTIAGILLLSFNHVAPSEPVLKH